MWLEFYIRTQLGDHDIVILYTSTVGSNVDGHCVFCSNPEFLNYDDLRTSTIHHNLCVMGTE